MTNLQFKLYLITIKFILENTDDIKKATQLIELLIETIN